MNRARNGESRIFGFALLALAFAVYIMAFSPEAARAAGVNVTVGTGGTYPNLAAAVTAINADGDPVEMNTITLLDTVSYGGGQLPTKKTTIKGNPATNILFVNSDMYANAPIAFDSLTIQQLYSHCLYGNGYPVVFESGVKAQTYCFAVVYGGGNTTAVTGNTSVILKGGRFITVLGGGANKGATVGGNASVTITGADTWVDSVYGGGADEVKGGTEVHVSDGATASLIFGGGRSRSATVGLDASVTVTGANTTTNRVYGGGYSGAVMGDTSVKISGATVNANVYGGGDSVTTNVYGNTSVVISGGATVAYCVYGGSCVGEVKGDTVVEISGGAAVARDVFGGDDVGTVRGGTQVVISGGAMVTGNVYGGGSELNTTVHGNTSVEISGGAKVTGSVNGGGMHDDATVVGGSSVTVSNAGGAPTLGDINKCDHTTFVISGTYPYSGTIASGGSLTKRGTGTLTLGGHYTVAAGKTLIIEAGALSNAGTLTNGGLLTNNGTLTNQGTVTNDGLIITIGPNRGTYVGLNTLAFDANGGAPSFVCAEPGTSFDLNKLVPAFVPVQAGSTFLGWSERPTGSMLSNPYAFTGGGTVYARWSSQSMTVTPGTAKLEAGETVQLTASVAGVTWTTSDARVATVNAAGLVTAVGPGEADITATDSDGQTGTCRVTTKKPEPAAEFDIGIAALAVSKGKTLELPVLAGYQGTWASDDPSIANVDTKQKRVKALALGVTELTYTVSSVVPKKALVLDDRKLNVNDTYTIKFKVRMPGELPTGIALDAKKLTLDLADNRAVKLAATVKPAKALDKEVFWTSSKPGVVTVDQDGNVTAIAPGTAKITAVTANLKRKTITVTVLGAVTKVTLSAKKQTLKVGETFTLTGKPNADALDQTITWSTSKPGVATVENGVVAAVKKGTAKITATASNGKKAVCTVTVK